MYVCGQRAGGKCLFHGSWFLLLCGPWLLQPDSQAAGNDFDPLRTRVGHPFSVVGRSQEQLLSSSSHDSSSSFLSPSLPLLGWWLWSRKYFSEFQWAWLETCVGQLAWFTSMITDWVRSSALAESYVQPCVLQKPVLSVLVLQQGTWLEHHWALLRFQSIPLMSLFDGLWTLSQTCLLQ